MGSTVVFVAGVVAALVAVWMAARRAITVALLEVEGGKLRVVSGGVAPGVLADLRDVVARPPVARARIRITRDGGLAAVKIDGDVREDQAQRIRNVVGRLPLAKLANR